MVFFLISTQNLEYMTGKSDNFFLTPSYVYEMTKPTSNKTKSTPNGVRRRELSFNACANG